MAMPLAGLLATAGCGPDTSTPQGQCAAQAEDDPTVKDIQMRSLGNLATATDLLPKLNDAKKAATLRCLQARGLAAPGGVEREKSNR